MASLLIIMAPSTDCSASIACGGVRSYSPGPDVVRASSASVMGVRPPEIDGAVHAHNDLGGVRQFRLLPTFVTPPARLRCGSRDAIGCARRATNQAVHTRGDNAVGIAARAVHVAVDNLWI